MPKLKFGKAFSDELKKTARASGHFHNKKLNSGNLPDNLYFSEIEDETSEQINPWMKSGFILVFILGFALLFGRAFHLQIAQGTENLELADSNRIQVKTIHAPRGVIYDRNGKILAANAPGFRLLNASGSGKPAYISREQAINMEVVNDPRLSDLEIDSLRTYPFAEKASHVLGYLGEISEDELKDETNKNYSETALRLNPANYKNGDKVGRAGVEEAYEKSLKGIDGGEIIEVDASGRKLRTLRKKDAIPGQNLRLTIDIDLQQVAFNQLSDALKKSGSCCGALVATDPNSGEILALVSIPSYNPDDLSNAITAANSPLLDRAIAGVYPPASTFKIVSGLGALESGKVTADTKYEDTGVMNLGPYSFSNWFFTQYGRKEDGQLDLVRALKRSNDIYFYQLGALIGEKSIADEATKLGFGKPTGIDISGEGAGLVPDPAWKDKNVGEVWYPGDTLHMAIGQGFLLATPLQVSNLISFVASGGRQYPPHLGLSIEDSRKGSVKQFKYDPINQQVNPEFMSLIKQGLEQVPQEGGTAWPFFRFPITTAGKTGTAEFGDPKNKTHAWYTAYAPADNPKITATVLIEAGGEGSSTASPVVKELFRWYFSPDKTKLIPDLGQVATDSAKILGE